MNAHIKLWRHLNALMILACQSLYALDEKSFSKRLKVLPLGDSITQVQANSSYRYPLWRKFLDHGIDVEFLGTLDDTRSLTSSDRPAVYRGRSYDGNHEGHWGWTADEILEELGGWLDKYETPDLTLIHLGTNDSFRGQDNAGTYLEIGKIISMLRQRNPDMLIVVAKIFPGFWGDVSPLNQELAKLAAPGVLIADCYTGMDLYEDSDDFAHPNASGGEKIADAWWEVLERRLDDWRQTYTRWSAGYGQDLDWNRDDDGDGWVNYMEFASRSDPLDKLDTPIVTWHPGGWLSPGFDPLRTRDQLILETSATPTGPFVNASQEHLDTGFHRWRVVSESGSPVLN